VRVGGPELCAGAVAVDHGLLLLVKRGTDPGKGLWSLPGGRVESGESVIAAVLREFKEETGLEGVCGSFVGWVERMGVDHHFVVMDFLVTVLEDGEPVAGGDAIEARWVASEELASMDLSDGLFDFLVEHGVLEDLDIRGA
jgi:8-oxo-dGTP diphosphatase